jgi:predicted Zn-dependent peptidase
MAGWRGPPARHADSAVLDVLQTVLAVGESSRLRRRLVEHEEIAVAAHASWAWRMDPGMFLLFVELAPGMRAAKAEAILWDELDRLATGVISASEVRRAQRLLRSMVLHELATHSGVAHALGQAEALLGDWREAGRALELYAAVGPKDLKRVAREWLDPTQRSVVTLDPIAPGAARGRRR